MAHHFSDADQQAFQHCDRWRSMHPRVLALLPLVALLAGCPQEEKTGTTKPYAQGNAKAGGILVGTFVPEFKLVARSRVTATLIGRSPIAME